MSTDRVSEFSKGYGKKGKCSREYSMVWWRPETLPVEPDGKTFDFGRSRSLESTFLSMSFVSTHQFKHGWY